MQLRFRVTLPNIFLTALVILLTWTSFAQGAAINRDTSPAGRDLREKASSSGVDVYNDDLLRRDDVTSATRPESLAARTAGEENENMPLDDNGDLSRRWYTLVEIAETKDSEVFNDT